MSTPTLTEIPGFLAGTWDIDASHSDVGFTVRHLVVTKVRGRFDGVSGHLVTTDDLATSSVEVVIDLSTINTHNEQRDGHLKSADFFEVDTYPALTYRGTGVRAQGDRYVLDGELTLKGITKTVPLTFELNGFSPDPWGGTRIGFSGDAEINRKDFNVNFEGVQNGIAVVSDKINIHIELEAVLRQDA
ncbi:Protein yceI precursor [Alloactinosynnema sp. L-07]|uniref:YceI family protein n=1 Tax=Alloactinosynnema sp. L-07 TaxID=1653480 RepID=UPI00065EFD86|nr:YceI family protein [Alloactinosynnema sp. L-07]CRK58138.1 Protein yceI precursor [Alloactinosynnema sp. L-07]